MRVFNDDEIRELYISKVQSIKGNESGKLYIKEAVLSDNKIAEKRIHHLYKRVSGVTVIIVIAMCIVAFGGATVYAFNQNAIISFFFGDSNKTSTDVLKIVNREYPFGKHKMIVQGEISDISTGVAYLSAKIVDESGYTVKNIKITNVCSFNSQYPQCFINGNINVQKLCVEDDEIYILFFHCPFSMNEDLDDDIIVMRFIQDRKYVMSNEDMFGYLVVNRENYLTLKEEIKKIELKEDLFQLLTPFYVPQAVKNLLYQYGYITMEPMNLGIKQIEIGKVNITISKTDAYIQFEKTADIENLSIIVGSSEIELIKDYKMVNHGRSFEVCESNGDEEGYYICTYGKFLKGDEKIKILLNGTEYE